MMVINNKENMAETINMTKILTYIWIKFGKQIDTKYIFNKRFCFEGYELFSLIKFTDVIVNNKRDKK